MTRDPARDALRERLWQAGTSLAEASLAIGRNKAYLHQYLTRGMPRVLSWQDSESLGQLLACDPAELRHAEIPAPKPWTGPKRRHPRSAPVREVEIEAAAGPGAWNEDFVLERGRWRLPEAMVRHECGASPESLRILKVRGRSMEPELCEGDRLVVDTERRMPALGELFVLWDGDGLVVKRVEPVRIDGGRADPARARLRLISANADYPPYERAAEEVHVVGRVLWKITRA